ncbi:Asp-tRNA(Asn)/Glu-tRNA(Gln) amidotransferase subunit GatB [Neolewinella antarctica]|uniref:Aspartyl/glutamyl-tRNA(Asn/Gln) amidotransferase subunit B n=1 Tax=Neolewinella antarctica TaxID=442734 RepID=A0ABX0XCF8_9BACT|nr:Asp-tRNA(Asn)/Glu-tRNA(Gln) amidotransferase subunit GatB [Neolewinella antarctica]NJC26462.1 aspartyl-tRNA(Asn)/glutamyl-tRNA(Gln) amidotransferase subunit B [Neolewinella antarctica]
MSSTKYETTIGLEAHVQLATESKAFCADRNLFGQQPNRNISEVSLGYPGTLPVLNEKQIRFAVKLGMALGCKINKRSTFDRKNYFYADLPKGYQITQERNPICLGGALPLRPRHSSGTVPESDETPPPKSVRLHHIHMEEDAGKSIHATGEPFTKVDLNRAGTPLVEIVTEPDLHSATEVDAFMTGMRRLVRWLGVSDGNMQEGSLRCDVNVSVRPEGQKEFGTRCEIKNMNSMKFARGAVKYEVQRQTGLLERGEKVVQQTRQYDPGSGTTTALRNKENAHDYRYFPDPDLPPVVLDDNYLRDVRAEIGTLPWEAYTTLQNRYGLGAADANLLSEDREDYEAFLTYAESSPDVNGLAKIWINRLAPWVTEESISTGELPLSPSAIASFQELIISGKVAIAAATGKLLPSLLNAPSAALARAKELGLIQNTDTDFLAKIVAEVITENPDKVATYRKGKKGLIGFFMGEVMKRSQGSAGPKETKILLSKALNP